MFVFLLAQLPLPIILFLNWRVTMRFLKVRELSRHSPIKKPKRLIIGWWINNLAIIFVLIPLIYERRLFVQDKRWLVSFGLSATMTIIGLLLMNSALGEELKSLGRRKQAKPVDTKRTDTL